MAAETFVVDTPSLSFRCGGCRQDRGYSLAWSTTDLGTRIFCSTTCIDKRRAEESSQAPSDPPVKP